MAKKTNKEHENPIIRTTNGLSSRGIIYVDVIIVVLVLAGAAFGGWYVWQKNGDGDKSKDSRTSQSGNETEDPINETADWIPVTTQGGAFSMKVPDGWKLTNYPDNFLGSAEVTYSPGVPAIVNNSDKEYVGHSLRFRASIARLDDAELGPQWSSPQPGLDETTKDFSIGSLQGKRYAGIFTQDLNQTLYEYVFDIGNNKKLDIVYTVDHSKNENDDIATVEKAIKTIKIN